MNDAEAQSAGQGDIPPPEKKGIPAWAVIVVAGVVFLVLTLFCVGILGAIFVPALAKARDAARRAVNQAQVNQIAIALQVYGVQNGNDLPELGADWQQRLLDTDQVGPEIFVAPNASPERVSYYYVPGYSIAADNPAGIILVYDNPDLITDFGVIGFLDGHVEQFPAGEFNERIMSITLPDGTPYRPHENE